MRIIVDEARCEGYGFCAEAAPHLLELDDEGDLKVLSEEVASGDAAQAEAAVRVCPVAALRLEP
ncbi:ferredoxin [Microtetraspora niveoalba]|uniref:ferredoxin n=1 Tax=Microtetraspora niveoalba TaxID=46175 RepID=UPI000831BB41|nr:ferredoxin [Microtetraspora niveoalba]